MLIEMLLLVFQSDGMVTRSGVFRGVVKEVLPPVRLSGGGEYPPFLECVNKRWYLFDCIGR